MSRTNPESVPSAAALSNCIVLGGIWLLVAALEVCGQFALAEDGFCFRAWECVTDWTDPHAPFRPFAVWTGRSHGDLAHFTGIPWLRRFRDQRFSVDEYGFRNPIGQYQRRPEVVVVGDSFAAGSQLSDDAIVGARIESMLGHATYTYAPAGLGQFMLDERFIDQPPAVVVSLHAEGALAHGGVAAPPGYRSFRPTRYPSAEAVRAMRSRTFRAGRVQASITRRSLVRHFGEPAFKSVLWFLGAYRLPPWVYTVDPDSGWIFYTRGSDHYLSPGAACLALEPLAAHMATADRRLRERGSRLIIIIAPKKEAIYHERLPALSGIDVTIFTDRLSASLTRHGIDHVVLQQAFAEFRTRHPEADLYLPDDTHMSAAAHELIVQVLEQSGVFSYVPRVGGRD